MLSKYLLKQNQAPLFMNYGTHTHILIALARMSFSSSSSSSVAAAMTTLEKDYYTILDIQVTATPEQIKDQYRRLAKKYHPDVKSSDKNMEHQPNPDLFRDVVEAYQVLSVRESRANYDLSRKKNPDLYKAVSDY